MWGGCFVCVYVVCVYVVCVYVVCVYVNVGSCMCSVCGGGGEEVR